MFELRQYFLLFLTATIWGSGFIGQKLGMNYVSPYTFAFMRTFIGALFLVPFIYFIIRKAKRKNKPLRFTKGKFLIGSLACGFYLILSESLQQFGLVTTDVNKTSFLTSLYMIFTPIIGVFLGQKLEFKVIVAVILSTFGLYLFCMKGDFSLEQGDLLVLLCALGFSLHILVIAYFVKFIDGVILSCGQFFCASLLGLIMMLLDGVPDVSNLTLAIPAILYCGIMSNGIAYTLQIVGQRGINPSIASLIMSLESVMGAIFGVLLLNETMSSREILGASLMFIAIILTQISFSSFKKLRGNDNDNDNDNNTVPPKKIEKNID